MHLSKTAMYLTGSLSVLLNENGLIPIRFAQEGWPTHVVAVPTRQGRVAPTSSIARSIARDRASKRKAPAMTAGALSAFACVHINWKEMSACQPQPRANAF